MSESTKAAPALPDTVSEADLLLVLRISHARLMHLIDRGDLPRPARRGHYRLAATVHAFIDFKVRGAKRDLDAARTRKLDNENARLEGRSVPRDVVEQAFMAYGQTMRYSLAGVEGRFPAQVLGERDAAVIRSKLRAEHVSAIRTGMEAFGLHIEGIAEPVLPGGEDVDAAAGEEPGAVGEPDARPPRKQRRARAVPG